MFVSGFCFLIGWSESLTLSLALLGKCAVTSSFCIITLYSAELYPTEVRYNTSYASDKSSWWTMIMQNLRYGSG